MSCPNLKPYNDIRKMKLEKINEYHKASDNSLLNKYQTFVGSTENETVMKRKYKTQMDNLNKEMLVILNRDVNLLIEQHNELEMKTKEVDDNDSVLKNVKQNIENESINNNARVKNNLDVGEIEKTYKFHHNILFISNVIILILILSGLIYVYIKL
jgi:hypothetical protein